MASIFRLLALGAMLDISSGAMLPAIVQKRQSPSCIDPTSQPRLRINDECPMSRTNISACFSSTAYKENCVAYCEQFLYSFLGPEVPFEGSQCQPNEACTFAATRTITVTNTYTFSAGLSGTGTDPFKLAFNLGASYSYSIAVAKAIAFQQTRPDNAKATCGYWTFLPYFITSCGFYLNSTRYSGSWGSYFMDAESWHKCDSHYNVVFGCSNTTYVDANGDPQGEVVFVPTACSNNERLPLNDPSQDPRYQSATQPNFYSIDADPVALNNYNYHYQGEDPRSDRACLNGCLCGYNRLQLTNPFAPSNAPYQACSCYYVLNQFWSITSNVRTKWNDGSSFIGVPVTKSNLSILQFYDVADCDNLAIESYQKTGLIKGTTLMWKVVDDDEFGTQKGPKAECFAPLIGNGGIDGIMNNFTYAGSITDKCSYAHFVNYNNTACGYSTTVTQACAA